ncbi:hypothetical protein DWX73_03430 [Coprococcus sp. AF21-14LB]|nr:hypothetical protein DWX73_03430 [Coprococcus sp. AF21-14LB]
MLLTTVKQALSVSLYEGIIFLSYFKEKYCDEIFASGAETEEFFYRLGIKDGLRLKSTVKSVLEMMS